MQRYNPAADGTRGYVDGGFGTRKQNNTTIPDILSVIYRECRGLLYLYFSYDANQYLPTAKYLA